MSPNFYPISTGFEWIHIIFSYGKLEDIDPVIVIFVMFVEASCVYLVCAVEDIHAKLMSLLLITLDNVVALVIKVAFGIIKVELECEVASDSGVNDKFVLLLQRWVFLEFLVCLGEYLRNKAAMPIIVCKL